MLSQKLAGQKSSRISRMSLERQISVQMAATRSLGNINIADVHLPWKSQCRETETRRIGKLVTYDPHGRDKAARGLENLPTFDGRFPDMLVILSN
eukprot:g1397.t1